MWNRLVKFRRGPEREYENLKGTDADGCGGQSPSQVDISISEQKPPSPTKSFQDDTFTVQQAVDAIGFGKFQVKLSLLTGLAWMADAMEMMILSILAPALHCDWKLVGWQQALITTVVFAGMMVSSGPWGKVCDKYGRKTELIFCSLVTFYYGFLSALAPTFIWLLILRGLVGFGIGGAPQSVTLYAEFLPSTSRAKCVVLIEEVKRGQLRDLFTKELKITTILLWTIWLATAFSYYGIVLMTTELFENGDECHGGEEGSADSLGEPACYLQCKQLSQKDYLDLLWTTVAEFPGLFMTLLIIEWFGRKKTMAVEFVIFSIFVFLVNLCTTRTVLTFLLFVARAVISGAFQAAYVYTPEVYPTTTRAMGLGACSGMSRIGALVTPFIAQVMLKESVTMTISIYGSICLISAVAALLLPIETKGREMMDVHISKPKQNAEEKG